MTNITTLFLTVGLSTLILTSCNNSDNSKTSEKELELQKRELDLKQKELELKEKELAQQDKGSTDNHSKTTTTATAPTKTNPVTTKSSTFDNTEENKIIIDTYIGKIGDKNFKLVIQNVSSNNISGYNVAGNNKRPVKGTILSKKQKGGSDVLDPITSVYTINLKEPGDDKWDGEFNLVFHINDQGRTGSGTWKSYDGKLNRKITFMDENTWKSQPH